MQNFSMNFERRQKRRWLVEAHRKRRCHRHPWTVDATRDRTEGFIEDARKNSAVHAARWAGKRLADSDFAS